LVKNKKKQLSSLKTNNKNLNFYNLNKGEK